MISANLQNITVSTYINKHTPQLEPWFGLPFFWWQDKDRKGLLHQVLLETTFLGSLAIALDSNIALKYTVIKNFPEIITREPFSYCDF